MDEYDITIQFTEEIVTVKANSEAEAQGLAMEEVAEYMRQGDLSFHIIGIITGN